MIFNNMKIKNKLIYLKFLDIEICIDIFRCNNSE